MALLATQIVSRATASTGVGGTSIVPVSAAANGSTADTMACGANMYLLVCNSGVASATITVAVPTARTYEANVGVASPAFSVQAGQLYRMFGPVDTLFADPSTGVASITASQSTVTYAAVQFTTG